ncbi:MAG TPA: aromatic ring-hydroxylating dioxygenase subunit alpha [Acidimicrobiales bacterium]|nr:aromatic ring-hydroxylating dioxygenase subunit alpha [Acidimicrobiales bacterium]
MVNQRSSDGWARETAPLEARELDLALRPFGQSRMLPRDAYVSEEVFAWEQRNFFAASWFCVGRSDSMPNPGDQRAESVGYAGVFLIRDSEGVLRAFANACRHRNHELLGSGEPTVNRPIVLCPYHGWSYRLDGSLRKAPSFDAGAMGLDPADNSLVQLPAAEWHGWIFVDGSGTAGPFGDHVAGLEDIIGPYAPERLRLGGSHDYVVQANWKILTENYHECYHCGLIHPELCAASSPLSGQTYIRPPQGAWSGGWMELRDGYETMSLDGRSLGTPLPGLDAHRRRIVDYIGLFPNLLISPHPDFVMTHLLTPLGPDRTRIQCGWAFAPEDLEAEGFDPSYAIDFWDITNRQDFAACESVQRGLGSEHAVAGVLSDQEEGVYQFITMVARGYSGLPLRSEEVVSAR